MVKTMCIKKEEKKFKIIKYIYDKVLKTDIVK